MKQRFLLGGLLLSIVGFLFSSSCGDNGTTQQVSSGSASGGASGTGGTGVATSGAGSSGVSGSASTGPSLSGAGAASGAAAATGAASGAGAASGVGAASGAGAASGSPTSGASSDGGNSGSPSSGMGSDASAPPPEGGAPVGNSVLERGNHPSRDAHYVQPKLSKAALANMKLDANFNATFTGTVFAGPLYLENGPAMAGCPAAASGCLATTRAAGSGLYFVATEQNNVYALDETSGAMVWKASLGASPGMGDHGPYGVHGTPVIDAASRTLFVATSIGVNGPDHHEVHALSVDDGSERMGWPVKLSAATLTVNNVAFQSPPQNQRGALSLVNGILYIPFGGYWGDQGNYHGWVVTISIADPTKVSGWVTAGLKEGIWAAGGLASDGTSVFAVTGDSRQGVSLMHTGTDCHELVRLTGMGVLNRTAANMYYPTFWQTEGEQGDLDFGSSSPAYVPLLPNSTPPAIVVAPHKAGRIIFLNANQLGNGAPGGGGELAIVNVAGHNQESVYTAPTAYHSTVGLYVAVNASQNAVCPAGGGGKNVVGILIEAAGATAPQPKTVWCAPENAGAPNQYNTFPISTTTDGTTDAIVWFINGTQLSAVDGDTGKSLANLDTCTGVQNMTSPIAVKGHIVVAASGHLCSWSPQ